MTACKWPKEDKRYIPPHKLEDASLADLIKYREICAREEQNEIEKARFKEEMRRNDNFLIVHKWLVRGAILSATIGGLSLIFVTLYNSGYDKNIIRELTNIKNNISVMGSDIGYLGREKRKDGHICKDNRHLLMDIHRKHFPERYPNVFGNFKPINQKKSE